MLKTKDGLIEIEVTQSISNVVLQPADWSIVNLPVSQAETASLFNNLYNTPISNHVVLALCRQRRKNRIEAMSNLGECSANWTYLETMAIGYERPSSCSNNGFLPVAEVGFLFYKGEIPDTKKTAWFSGEKYNNSTNLWDLSSQEDEADYIYYQKFSWEMNLLMKNLASSPLETRRFIYGHDVSVQEIASIHKFCKEYQLTCQLFTKTVEEAKTLIDSLKEGK